MTSTSNSPDANSAPVNQSPQSAQSAPEGSPTDMERLNLMRHSCAHLMAAAILELHPGAKFGVGPVTENGFFYDVMFDTPLGDAELAAIESRMRKLRKKKVRFVRREVAIDDARQVMSDLGQNFKVELLDLLRVRGSTAVIKETGDSNSVDENNAAAESGDGGVKSVSFYDLGNFIDLCRGPHVEHTGEIGAFKLSHVAGAYWRGDERNPQLQRIYGLCFANQQDLDTELWRIEQRKLRDHRKLGRELEIFSFSREVGSGLPLWLPNGTIMRQELERLARQREAAYGYQQVITPQITRASLYHQSGHLPYYSDDMYPPMKMDDGEEFYVRPMNCPHHHHVFLSKPRVWRDMPVRLAEYGDVFRYEPHGALSGLMRTRCFCQNDAHIYCSAEQARDEFVAVMRMHAEYYDLFDIDDYYMRLSLPDMDKLDKYVDDPQQWATALEIIRAAMQDSGYPYVEAEGEAAFYGPKVDFMIRSAIGTEYAISTNQLDFLATSRFDLKYKTNNDTLEPVYVIHRAPLGSHERFVAFLIEHYAGAFPTWLSPVQAVIIPIADRHHEAVEKIRNKLSAFDVRNATDGLRVQTDLSSERMQKKVRNATMKKIPYILIVGDREAETESVSVRLRSGADLGTMTCDKLVERMQRECENRRDTPPQQALADG